MGNLTARVVLLAAALAGSGCLAWAQTTIVPGGVELTLGVAQRLEFDDNLALATTKPGASFQAKTTLSFALKSETPNDRIGISASTVVRGTWGKGNANRGIKADDPRFDLTYAHDSGNSGYNLSANFRRSNLQFLRPLTDFQDANGNIVLPTDLSDLFGNGFRTDFGVVGGLSLGKTAPFGANFTVGLNGLSYDKVTSTALVDSQNRTFGANFRLRLNDVTDASANFSFVQFENLATSNKSNSRTVDLGLTRALANGTAGVTVSSRNSPRA